MVHNLGAGQTVVSENFSFSQTTFSTIVLHAAICGRFVTVWSPPSDASVDSLIMCTIDSGHLEAFYGGKEGSKEAVLV